MTNNQAQKEAGQRAHFASLRTITQERFLRSSQRGRQLLASFCEFLKGRDDHQGGMYLPLVRRDHDD